jgi:hypothetical protein
MTKNLQDRLQAKREEIRKTELRKLYRATLEGIPGLSLLEFAESGLSEMRFTEETLLASLPHYYKASRRLYTDEEVVEWYKSLIKQKHLWGKKLVYFAIPQDPSGTLGWMKVELDADCRWVSHMCQIAWNIIFFADETGEYLEFYDNSEKYQFELSCRTRTEMVHE